MPEGAPGLAPAEIPEGALEMPEGALGVAPEIPEGAPNQPARATGVSNTAGVPRVVGAARRERVVPPPMGAEAGDTYTRNGGMGGVSS